MTNLAVRMLRHRPGSALATLIALAVGVGILTAMGALVESGLRYQPEPHRYAAVDLVVARTDISFTDQQFGERETTTVRLPEAGALPAGLADRIRRLPGVAATVALPPAGAPSGRIGAVGVRLAPGADRVALTTELGRLLGASGARVYAGADRGIAEQPA